jgi:predicted transcriptional regulator
MEKNPNPFKTFIDTLGISVHKFAKENYMSPFSLYNIYNGKAKPRRKLAKKLFIKTKGALTLKDFGYD